MAAAAEQGGSFKTSLRRLKLSFQNQHKKRVWLNMFENDFPHVLAEDFTKQFSLYTMRNLLQKKQFAAASRKPDAEGWQSG